MILTGDQRSGKHRVKKLHIKLKRIDPFNLNKTDIDETNKSNILNRLNESVITMIYYVIVDYLSTRKNREPGARRRRAKF